MTTVATSAVDAEAPESRDSVWFRNCEHRPAAKLRLFCLAHAGGSASVFKDWARHFDAEIEVRPIQLPGRENRWRTPPITELHQLSSALLAALRPYLDRPFAFYGHSLGALIAFELGRRLRDLGLPRPVRLFAASRRAPQLSASVPNVQRLPDDEFVSWLVRAGSAAEAMNDPRWRKFYLPTVRADLAVSEEYSYYPEAPFSFPVVAYGGRNDRIVSPEELAAWRIHTSAPFSKHEFPGGHLFYADPAGVSSERPSVELMCESMNRYLKGDLAERPQEVYQCTA